MYDYLSINAIYSFVGSNVQQINRTIYFLKNIKLITIYL